MRNYIRLVLTVEKLRRILADHSRFEHLVVPARSQAEEVIAGGGFIERSLIGLALIRLEAILVVVHFLNDLQTVKSRLMVVTQHLRQQMLEERTDMTRDRNPILFQHFQIRLHFQTLIASLPDQHLIQNHPKSPNIALFRVQILHIRLRCHVLRRPNIIKHLRLIRHLAHLAIPKIYDGNLLADFWFGLEEDVIWFDIAMHHTFPSDVSVSFDDLPEDNHCFFFLQAVGVLLEVLCQRSAL